MKWRLAVPETGGRAAGLNTRRSQRYATALSEPLKLTGSQKTALPMLRPPKLTLLWPISRNSIPSQSPDLRSPKRDNSSPWKKELDEDAQIVRGREGYLHFPAPDSVYSSAWQACRLSGDRGRCGEPRRTGAPPPPSSPRIFNCLLSLVLSRTDAPRRSFSKRNYIHAAPIAAAYSLFLRFVHMTPFLRRMTWLAWSPSLLHACTPSQCAVDHCKHKTKTKLLQQFYLSMTNSTKAANMSRRTSSWF